MAHEGGAPTFEEQVLDYLEKFDTRQRADHDLIVGIGGDVKRAQGDIKILFKMKADKGESSTKSDTAAAVIVADRKDQRGFWKAVIVQVLITIGTVLAAWVALPKK